MEDMKDEAVAAWQDKLAKFFATAPGPSNIEIEIFRLGWESGYKKAVVACLNSCLGSDLNKE